MVKAEFEKKWGQAAGAGFQQVPDLLLRSQSKLGLASNDMVVLLHIVMHWWYADKLPFPATATIAKRMGQTPRTVQRSLKILRDKGLIAPRQVAFGKDVRRCWDPAGLVDCLSRLASADPVTLARTNRLEKVIQ